MKGDSDGSEKRFSEKDRSEEHAYSRLRLPQQQHLLFAALFGRQKARSYGIGYTITVLIRRPNGKQNVLQRRQAYLFLNNLLPKGEKPGSHSALHS